MNQTLHKSTESSGLVRWNGQTSKEIIKQLAEKKIVIPIEKLDIILEDYINTNCDNKLMIRSLRNLNYSTLKIIAFYMIVFKISLSDANELVVFTESTL